MLRWVIICILLVALAVWGWSHFSAGTKRADAPVTLKPELWQAFEKKFVESGRVVDRENGGISHSEGQGYGMRMAEAAGDRAGFDALWGWTSRVLKRNDGLFSWRYEPCTYKDKRCITDTNNATDGEILIAWALLRAYARWEETAYLSSAKAIADATMKHSVVTRDGRRFILPGQIGFNEGDILTLNGSYWVFPALEAFSAAGWPLWDEVIASGLWLVENGRFGTFHLPPDWVDLKEQTLAPSQKFDPLYGYNAVRILLHMAWSYPGVGKQDLAGYEAFWHSRTPPPAWIRLDDGRTADYGLSTGMAAITTLAQARAYNKVLAPEALPLPGEDEGYFSWALSLLAQIAAAESAR